MKTAAEIQNEIYVEISRANKSMNGTFTNEISDATNRVAISNLYIALATLQTTLNK